MGKLVRPQYHRARRILAMIRNGTHSGMYPSAAELAGELEVSWRTVMRDLDFLRDDECVPIEYDASRKGFFLSDSTWHLPPLTLSAQEVFAFSVGRKALEAFEGTPLDMGMRSVLNKITSSLQGNITIDIESLTDDMTILREDYVIQDRDTWERVAGFLNRREWMKIRYQRFDGEIKKYQLAPYHLIFYHGNWYVLGARGAAASKKGIDLREVATFAMSRMQRIEGTGNHFKTPRSFDPRKHIEASFGIVRGEQVFKVRILFSRKVATYIRERQWHPTQKITNRRDGSIVLSMETAGWKELIRWILSWQPDAKVLSPRRLKERVELKMRQALGIQQLTPEN